jgi:hypothetical protein
MMISQPVDSCCDHSRDEQVFCSASTRAGPFAHQHLWSIINDNNIINKTEHGYVSGGPAWPGRAGLAKLGVHLVLTAIQ